MFKTMNPTPTPTPKTSSLRFPIAILGLLICLFLVTGCKKDDDSNGGGNPQPVLSQQEQLENRIHVLVNQHRASINVAALAYSPDVIRPQCRNHSLNMEQGRVPFSHDGFKTRLDSINLVSKGRLAGENCALLSNGSTVDATAQQALTMWLGSKGHRANIENPNFTLTGVGAALNNSTGYVYLTQIFQKADK